MDIANKIFLTFDIDWATDEVLGYAYGIVEKHDVNATFFVTHDTPFLQTLKGDKKIELGLHPNFNGLLNGDNKHDFRQIIDELLFLDFDAVSYRSHCLTNSSIISKYISTFLKYSLNYFIPEHSGMTIKPFINPFGMYEVPHFFEDLYTFSDPVLRKQIYTPKGAVKYLKPDSSLKVFDFHPIHVYLNSEVPERYEGAKIYYKDFNMLKSYVNKDNFGTEDFLVDLIETAKSRGFEFLNIRDIEL